jgi:hypothetical protein
VILSRAPSPGNRPVCRLANYAKRRGSGRGACHASVEPAVIKPAAKLQDALQAVEATVAALERARGRAGVPVALAPAARGAATVGRPISLPAGAIGREASIEELKALTPATTKDLYKRYLAPAASIESPLVRAAFLNISVMNGPRRATQVFQAAGEKISGTEIIQDGIFGPQSIVTINASAAKDPGLVVETANCIILQKLKPSPLWE